MLVGALRAGGDGALDAAGALVPGQGDGRPGPAPPGLVQGVRQQRQHPGGEGAGLAVAHLGQQDTDEVVVDLGACFPGRFGDRHPQLPLGHRGDQVAVLDRAGQLPVLGAAGLEVGADRQHHQPCWGVIRAVPGGGGRVQRGDERPPLPLVGALGEHLLELVHDEQQPPRPWRLILLRRGAAGIAGQPIWLLARGGLPGGESEPGRIGFQPASHRRRIGPRQRRYPQR